MLLKHVGLSGSPNNAGVVNAVEVVHAFDSDDGLIKFRRWVLSPDTDEFASAVTGGSGRGRGRGSRGRCDIHLVRAGF